MSSCFEEAKASGAIIHSIALGPSAAKELETLSNMTGNPLECSLNRNYQKYLSHLMGSFPLNYKTAQKFPVLKINLCPIHVLIFQVNIFPLWSPTTFLHFYPYYLLLLVNICCLHSFLTTLYYQIEPSFSMVTNDLLNCNCEIID